MSKQVDSTENGQDKTIVEIDVKDLSTEQRTALKLVLVTLFIESIVLAGVQLVTGFFKIFIKESQKLITDYVSNYISSLTPYLFVLILFLLLYQAYVFIVNDSNILKDFSDAFEILRYVLLGIFTLIIIFGMINAATYAQLFIFIFIILLLANLCLIPSNYFYSKTISSLNNKNSEEIDNKESV